MELKEFELFLNGTIMKFGDIVIDKCTVKKETDASTFTGQQNLTFSGDAAALGTCATTVEGTVESGALTMNINVKVATLQQTVKDRLPESAATTHFNLTNTIHIILRKTRILHAKNLLATLNKVRY